MNEKPTLSATLCSRLISLTPFGVVTGASVLTAAAEPVGFLLRLGGVSDGSVVKT